MDEACSLGVVPLSAENTRRTLRGDVRYEPGRLTEIRTRHAYPDGYEIATIERAYKQRIWPQEHE